MKLADLKNIIKKSNLDSDVKSYEDSGDIIFYVFPGKKAYEKVLHFRVKPTSSGNKISVRFCDYGKFCSEKISIRSVVFPIPNSGERIVNAICDKLNGLRDQVRLQPWCPVECRSGNGEDGNTGISNASQPKIMVKEPAPQADSEESINSEYVINVEKNFIKKFNSSLENWTLDDNMKEQLKIKNGEISADNPLFHIFFSTLNDPKKIDDYNRQCDQSGHFIYKYFPQEGICGNPKTAKILIFSNNPGAGGFWDDYGKNTISHVINMLKENFESGHEFTGALTPCEGIGNGCFYQFLDTYIYHNRQELSTRYWRDHLLHQKINSGSDFLLDYELKNSKKRPQILMEHKGNILTLERFGYHTSSFDQNVLRNNGLFSDHIAKLKRDIIDIVNAAIKDSKILVFSRGWKSWQNFLGEETVSKIKKHEFTFFTSSTNPHISSRNIVDCDRNGQDGTAFNKLLVQYIRLCNDFVPQSIQDHGHC